MSSPVTAAPAVRARLEPVAGARFERLYAVYRDLYPLLAPTMARLGELARA